MPKRDGRGPMGLGPGTGRGMGSCGQGNGSVFGRGRGFGRAMGGRFYGRQESLTETERKNLLKEEIGDMKQELQTAEKELSEMEK